MIWKAMIIIALALASWAAWASYQITIALRNFFTQTMPNILQLLEQMVGIKSDQ